MLNKALVLLVAMTGVAHADDAVPATPEATTSSPGFVILERFDSNSRAGGDLTYLVLEGDADVTLLRLDLHGHYVDPTSGFGGYAQVPIATVFGEGDSATALGNLEVGAIYVPKLASPVFGVVVHAGLTLPTGPAPDDEDGIVGVFAGYMRPTDLYQVLPRSSTLRLGVSPMVRSDKVFARLDIGADVNLYAAESEFGGSPDIEPAFHLNVGAGVDLGQAAIMAEVSCLRSTEDGAESLVVGALSVRGTGAKVRPYGALAFPLTSDLGDFIDLGITGGVEAGF